MKTLLIRKLTDIREDEIYPNCHICNKELSLYGLVKDSIDEKLLDAFKKCSLVKDETKEVYIVLMCKKCCGLTSLNISIPYDKIRRK